MFLKLSIVNNIQTNILSNFWDSSFLFLYKRNTNVALSHGVLQAKSITYNFYY